ncbi:MAG TPA: hypothetical protein VJM50_23990 [Pyrinomonadaceae bacterium]|nr:hypothetical protein [Pyrinomonadaceae bacterium]
MLSNVTPVTQPLPDERSIVPPELGVPYGADVRNQLARRIETPPGLDPVAVCGALALRAHLAHAARLALGAPFLGIVIDHAAVDQRDVDRLV